MPSTGPARRPRTHRLALVQAVLTLGTVVATVITPAAASAAVPVPPPGRLTSGPIEALQPYVGQSVCDPVAKPGVRAFSDLLLSTYTDTTSLGIVRDCGIGGQSEHKEGRAFDWGVSVSNAHQVTEVNAVLSWLLKADAAGNTAANARRLGIMYIIWNGRMWRAYAPEKGWQPYTGADGHTGHVHFSFGWSGAKKVTSYWDGTVAPTDYGPSGKPPLTPDRVPANLLVLATYGSLVLREGTSETAATKLVQKVLEITVDGQFGPATTAALKAFQADQSIPADGVVNSDDWLHLFPKPELPFGALESAVFGPPGTVAVAGWAADADTVNPLRVTLYVDNKPTLAVTAGGSRPEIERLFPGMGPELGFTANLDLVDGVHDVCAYGINTGPGANTLVGCRTVSVRHQATGHVDQLAVSPTAVLSSGWTIDPDSLDTVQVTQRVDGIVAATVPANVMRTDVGSRYPVYGGNRGFSSRLDLAAVPEGTHTFCTVATKIGPGTDATLGCVTSPVRHQPFGSFDLLTQGPAGITLGGWGIEPDTSGPATVTATLDGVAVPAFTADRARSDLARLFPVDGGAHGFHVTVPTPSAEGLHKACVTIANAGPGATKQVGCRTITVSHQPFGRFDKATVTGGRLLVQGWALDPDSTSPVAVHVRIDGALVGKAMATVPRSDVGRAYPAYTNAHGFRYSPPTVLSPGVHKVCLYLINVGAGTRNPGLGCRQVTV